jgi:hypothetical protein
MRQERIPRRPVRRKGGGGADPDPPAPLPARPGDALRRMQKADELLRRLERLVNA